MHFFQIRYYVDGKTKRRLKMNELWVFYVTRIIKTPYLCNKENFFGSVRNSDKLGCRKTLKMLKYVNFDFF